MCRPARAPCYGKAQFVACRRPPSGCGSARTTRRATSPGSLLHRPAIVEALSHTALDLNRLAPYVAALQNQPFEVHILHAALTSPCRDQSRLSRAITSISRSRCWASGWGLLRSASSSQGVCPKR